MLFNQDINTWNLKEIYSSKCMFYGAFKFDYKNAYWYTDYIKKNIYSDDEEYYDCYNEL